ncbi:Rad9-domain-containing protein [Earliella scabrosa]|nr:Rad9-domain-containing protein [Earliella scabrosa]
MQATLDTTGYQQLTRAFLCLSKFGEEVVVSASPDLLSLSSTNSSMSAFGHFKYPRSFFSRYRVDAQPMDGDEEPTVTGQINLKPLLSILKHKTNEKACEKCELIITDGPSQSAQFDDEEEQDTLESRLTVRLHCKHGVVKTHRLPLNHSTGLMPTVQPSPIQSRLVIGPKTLKGLLEHFPLGRGSKADPKLMWNFLEDEVQLRSLEPTTDAKGDAHLVTELTISVEAFDLYDLQAGEMSITFHLREFFATIAFAEASKVPLEISFTDPAEPVYISVDTEFADNVFLIATSLVQSSQRSSQRQRENGSRANDAKGKKRPLEDDSNHRNVRGERRGDDRPRKPMKVVQRVDRASMAREMRPPNPPQAPQPSWAILTAAQQQQQPARAAQEPLFLPGSQLSQLPPEAEAAIIESGLGIENMTAEEFEAMLEGDAEEVEFGEARVKRERSEDGDGDGDEFEIGGQVVWRAEDLDFGSDAGEGEGANSFELVDDVEMEPTQHPGGIKVCAILMLVIEVC